jgi:glycosyltransferase involved in cell wall biosynthesis
LVKPFNSEQFSDAILYLLEHKTEAAEMGIKARKTIVEQYDWRIVVKKAIQVYEEALRDL